jgi:hypothetical protein
VVRRAFNADLIEVAMSRPRKPPAVPGSDRGSAPTEVNRKTSWIRLAKARLREPSVLVIIAVAFLVSSVLQTVVEAFLDEVSVATTAVLSVLGSLFLAAAIITAARRHDKAARADASAGSVRDHDTSPPRREAADERETSSPDDR